MRLRQLTIFDNMLHAVDHKARGARASQSLIVEGWMSSDLALAEWYLQIRPDVDPDWRVLSVGSVLQKKVTSSKPLVHDRFKVRVPAHECFREARNMLAHTLARQCDAAVLRMLSRIEAMSPCAIEYSSYQPHKPAACQKESHPSVNAALSRARAELLVRAARVANAVHTLLGKWPVPQQVGKKDSLTEPNRALSMRLWNGIFGYVAFCYMFIYMPYAFIIITYISRHHAYYVMKET